MADWPDRLADALAGRYRIERLLRCGMARVYLAQDLKHPRQVAIKLFETERAAVMPRKRFLRKIEIASKLQHRFLVPFLDFGAVDELLYYVMPYLEGDTLRHRLDREKQLPIEEALCIAADVAVVLDYLHQAGVIHRDIRPEAILLESGHALVADLDIARMVGLAGGSQPTGAEMLLGTPAYMSTEQVLGQGFLDGRSDQYSLACVVYEMLAGQPPFAGVSAESILYQHCSVPPRPVTDLRPAAPAGVARALSRALSKAPADRFASAGEFASALGAAAGPIADERVTLTPPPKPRGRYRP